MFGREPSDEDEVDLAERLRPYSIEDRPAPEVPPAPDHPGEPVTDPSPSGSRWDLLPPRP